MHQIQFRLGSGGAGPLSGFKELPILLREGWVEGEEKGGKDGEKGMAGSA